jgi:RimJ/RimL family protein N-acetyltransferase
VLKQFVVEDAKPVKAIMDYNREFLLQYGENTGLKYTTEEEFIESVEHPKDPTRLRFGIWEGKTLVGSINLHPRAEGVAEVGYWLGEEHIGHGYGAKATRAISKYGFEQDYKMLFAKVHPKNKASQRTLENAGYKFDREDVTEDGDPVLIYEMNKDDISHVAP